MGIVRTRLKSMIEEAIQPIVQNQDELAIVNIELDTPKIAAHGDYASNIALGLTRVLKRNPRQIASEIIANLEDSGQILQKIEIAGPGFINFFIRPEAWC